MVMVTSYNHRFSSTGDPVSYFVELERPGGVHAGTVRTTVPGLVGERFLSRVRVTNGGHGVAAQRQAYVQGQSGPQ